MGVEDAAARNAGRTLAAISADPNGPSWCGIRFKGMPASERRRSIRTLELVLDAAGGVPAGFVFTVPKLRAVEQVTATVLLCEELEKAHGLATGSLRSSTPWAYASTRAPRGSIAESLADVTDVIHATRIAPCLPGEFR